MLSDFLTFLLEQRAEILHQTYEHLWITLVALAIATVIGISIGILLTRYEAAAQPILGFVNIVQTIPSIALLGFMLPFFGIGVLPAIIALFLYALLPIVRNTYTGIQGVDNSIKEAALGMGMTNEQILRMVELPLAAPIIFAGVRTAMVINIGVATLCALIAAGGLGEFIFRGIAVNNTYMILAGAIPASLLAIVLDTLLSLIQRYIQKLLKPLAVGFTILCLALIGQTVWPEANENIPSLVAGFNSEFMERADGYPGLQQKYGFSLEAKEMEIGLMYEALHKEKVDVISGFSTDGRIAAYNLRVLEDDLQYFPPYYAAPLVRQKTIERFPELKSLFQQLAGKVDEAAMMQMNFEVDRDKRSPRTVAQAFLDSLGFITVAKKEGNPDLIIGSKAFTENFILAELFALLIEGQTNLTVELKQGFGGTKLLMDAIINGYVDIYPEYTGTALLVLLKPEATTVDSLVQNKEWVYDYVQREVQQQYNLIWLPPLGFNNTTALMMREQQAQKLGIESISDLKKHLGNEQ
ncbi:ABC transporter permease/substrate-binding protein [Tunicatimonas pelagia]|uniref:ABC transporter permease/substrate-binding protein n=1 Tax=Tunicatimonas pelagia TaxID=931531 RepID=UPI0026670793|nr:ABC transporter permease/substrate-binding protein [Tunicatimonas pelagia]WKN44077.1 ABC transporter permease/substrate-binding protein [Tunicatimonas pelagia]